MGQLFKLFLAYFPEYRRGHALDDINNVNQSCLTVLTDTPGQHRPPATEDGWYIYPDDAHEHAGYDFVTVRYQDKAVQEISISQNLHGIGDEFAAGQIIPHTRSALINAFTKRNGTKLKRYAASTADTGLYRPGDIIQMGMPGEYLAFIDADVQLSRNWLATMLHELEAKPERVLVSAIQQCGPDAGAVEKARVVLNNALADQEVEFLGTANLFMARRIFEKVGGFPGGEDILRIHCG